MANLKEVMTVLRNTTAPMTMGTIAIAINADLDDVQRVVKHLEERGEVFQIKQGLYQATEPVRTEEETAREAEQAVTYASNSTQWTEAELLTIPDERKRLRLKLFERKADIAIMESLIAETESKLTAEIASETVETNPLKYEKRFTNEGARRAELRIRLGEHAKYQSWEAALKKMRREAADLEYEIDRLKERHYGLQNLVELKRSKEWEAYTATRRAP